MHPNRQHVRTRSHTRRRKSSPLDDRASSCASCRGELSGVTVSGAPSFGDLLKKYRVAAGVTQEHLAEIARVSANAISTLERGARRAPHRDTVELLASALGLSGPRRHEFEYAAESVRVRGATSPGDAAARAQLPAQLTSLVGRERELTTVLELLDAHRLVTIAGTGGIGKTRLALAAGEQFAQARAIGAWFVDLAAVRESADVAGKIASSLGAAIDGSGDPLEELCGPLRSRRGLVVLDNCEHVIEEAARAAAAILRSCPGITMIATSRERLAVGGESVYALGPLSPAGALELFRLRAAGTAPPLTMTHENDAIAGEICRQVDGIPLAIELAAARVRFLGLSELRARLRGRLALLAGGPRDAPARQQTMHDTVAWSYGLLDSAERALFRRLAVFAGGWSLGALEPVVVDAPLDALSVVAALSSLAEKSLLVVDLEREPVRYRLLEPVRIFARGRLEAAGEFADFRYRHAQWFAQVAEASRDDVELLAREIDNLRAALEWALRSNGDAVLAARIAGGPGGAWARVGLLAECRRWCGAALERLGDDADPDLSARIYRALLMAMGSKNEIATIVRAIPFSERSGDWEGVAVLTSRLALRYSQRGRFDEAERAFDRVWEIRDREHIRKAPRWATVWMHRASIYRREGRLDEADAAIAESLALARTLEKPLHEMWALLVAGEVAFARGDLERAIASASDAVAICSANRHTVGEIFGRANLAGYYLAAGDYGKARAQVRASLALSRDVPASSLVSAILRAAALDAVEGDAERAAVLKGYFDAAVAREDLHLDATDSSSYRILTSELEHRLSAETSEIHGRSGAVLTDAEAISLALSVPTVTKFAV
jgi:predicted ATPase/DNA-binding XRE family transcriptional regulator